VLLLSSLLIASAGPAVVRSATAPCDAAAGRL
jgi:hypothetical protein